jgi:hypothetical protein
MLTHETIYLTYKQNFNMSTIFTLQLIGHTKCGSQD